MLNPELFENKNEHRNVNRYLLAMKNLIEQQTLLKVKGRLKPVKKRIISYYDTPNSCLLREQNYILREREQQLVSQASYSFKYRSSNQLAVESINLKTAGLTGKHKFERDTLFLEQHKVVNLFSRSVKFSSADPIDSLANLKYYFPTLLSDPHLVQELPLQRVSGLHIDEHLYQGYKVDLGSVNGKLSLTLWYVKSASLRIKPVIAEVSISISNKKGKANQKVLDRASQVMIALTNMSNWNTPKPMSKTSFVYAYQPTFCSP